MNDLLNYFFKNWIAIVSLVFSFVTWSRNRKIITFDFDKDIQIAEPNSIFCFNNEVNTENYEYCLVTSLSVVNHQIKTLAFLICGRLIQKQTLI